MNFVEKMVMRLAKDASVMIVLRGFYLDSNSHYRLFSKLFVMSLSCLGYHPTVAVLNIFIYDPSRTTNVPFFLSKMLLLILLSGSANDLGCLSGVAVERVKLL